MTQRKTALHSWHENHQARLVNFGGWSMPVQYESIVNEHLATRTGIGVFDVSHMGRLYFRGKRAAEFLDYVVTRRVHDLAEGQIRYGLICNQEGGILDDVLVYRLKGQGEGESHMMVVNAGNREKIVRWLHDQQACFGDVQFDDRTEATGMIAIQGPRALRAVQIHLDAEVAALKYYHGKSARFDDSLIYVSRTGYTGEDGCELIVESGMAESIWTACLAADPQARPAGLGARDTLRLEAGMPLYGHELTEEIDPFQADLGFAVNLKDRDFMGRQALIDRKKDSTKSKRVGLVLSGRRPAREHYPVFSGDRKIGEVTSGTLSPTLGYPIAMAYVSADCSAPDTVVEVELRGTRAGAKVVPLPFYQRTS